MKIKMNYRQVLSYTIYEIALTRVEQNEAKNSESMRKWLGVPRMLTSVALYGRSSSLRILASSIVKEYKVSKVRLQLMLIASEDRTIWENPPTIQSGTKWQVMSTSEEAEGSAKQREVMGMVQGRNGLGLRRVASGSGRRKCHEMV